MSSKVKHHREEKLMKKHCVYKIETNGAIYIGVTNNLRTRMRHHLRANSKRRDLMLEHGHTCTEILGNLTEEEAYEIEEMIVDQEFIDRPDVLNKVLGGLNLINADKEGKKDHGRWLAKTHGKEVFSREGHQSSSARSRWDNLPEGWRSPLLGKVFDEKEKEELYPKATCPSCGKSGNARGIKQWHGLNGEKCKHNA
jgi:predicted GIY-YIG superfamily endonuclease